jgi:ribosomal protein L11 methyltransferase
MKTYLEISISANQEQREILIPTMVELGCEGFQETDFSLLCYLDKSHWNNDKYQFFKDQLKNILRTVFPNASISFREIVEKDWNEEWERTIQPIEIGNRLVIKPSWCQYSNVDNRIIIHIDPKMSFGTGYHETTRLTLIMIEKYLTAGYSVLDVGTGTGILAIAAVKLGARAAVGIDNDEWSIENANDNIITNQVSDRITITTKQLNEFLSSSFDLVTANLTLNTNIELLQQFSKVLKPNGILLLSGLLQKDEDKMLRHLNEKNFRVLEILRENEWIAIAVRSA